MANIELCIARLRRQRGISQQQLAERMGVAFQTVSKWETGAAALAGGGVSAGRIRH